MIELINSISYAWGDWMIAMLWQSSLLILIVGSIDYLTRRWVWPQVRYALWMLVLIKLVIPPSWSLEISFIPPAKQIVLNKIFEKPDEYSHTLPDNVNSEKQALQPGFVEDPVENNISKQKEINPGIENASVTSAASPSIHTYILFVWILGIIVFTTVLLLRIKKLRRWHREQEEKNLQMLSKKNQRVKVM